MSRDARTLLVVASLVAALPTGAACSNDAPGTPAPTATNRNEISDVIYGLGTTDEGLLTLLDAHPVDAAASKPIIVAPADHAPLDALTSFTYQASKTSTGGLQPRPPRRRAASSPLDGLFTFEGVAFAHGAPMNGEAYWLVFQAPSDPKLVRVFTQGRTYVPSNDAWQKLAEAQGQLTLTVTRAVFEEGRLTTDGGPFVSEALHFTIVP